MKKAGRKLAFGAAVMTAALNLTACNNRNAAVYGPPESGKPETDLSTEAESVKPEAESGTQTEQRVETELITETEAALTEFDPDDNLNNDVYGPPEDFEMKNNMIPAVYGPPEDMQ